MRPPGPPLLPIRKTGMLFESSRYKDTKDPCIVYDGTIWHIYGSGGDSDREEWEILHATAPSIEGPWTEQDTVILRGVDGPHVAAPGVVYDPEDKLFHMCVQKDCFDVGGDIAYLVSADGHVFSKMRTILAPNRIGQAGLYDPHFSEVDGKKLMAYSSMPTAIHEPGRTFPILQPDVYLARSVTDRWSGEWKRMKSILRHEEIAWHHNQREHPDYEWGIEGPQVLELPSGAILLNATCFIAEGRRGTRQRVFFALSNELNGPYLSIGPILPTDMPGVEEWENGENGHASAIVQGSELYLFYQARSQKVTEPKEANNWRYGIAVYSIGDILRAGATEQSELPPEEQAIYD